MSLGKCVDLQFWYIRRSLVIEDLKKNKQAGSRLLSFYCDYRFPEKSKAEYLFRSLLGQLLRSLDGSLPQAPSPVHDILAKFSRTRSVADIPLADVLRGLATCSSCEHLTIVIDALDECQDREGILSLLHQLPSSSDVTARFGWLTAWLRHLADQKWL